MTFSIVAYDPAGARMGRGDAEQISGRGRGGAVGAGECRRDRDAVLRQHDLWPEAACVCWRKA